MSFFQLRYALALIMAITIDAFQLLLGIVIAAVFATPGAAGGIIGCVISTEWIGGSCWLGGVIGGVVHVAADILSGGALQGLFIAFGAGLATVVDFCFSALGFALIIPMLIVTGIVVPSEFFLSWRRGPFLLAKIIPGIDMLPFFTGLVVMSILECEAKKKGGVTNLALAGATGSVAGAAAYAKSIGSGINQSTRSTRQTFAQTTQALDQTFTRATGRVPLVQDIRPTSRQMAANRPSTNDSTTIFRESGERVAREIKEARSAPTLREGNLASRRLMERPA
ncbi:MAG: hypothetical protein ACREGH_01450 [Minisyncoccia bacterium]